MGDIFVPVDLDQVLDEFEEQEKNNQEPVGPQCSRPDSLDLPYSLQDGQLQLPSISEPRTYSFNSPLDAMLQEHTHNNVEIPAKSLAQELADLNFGIPKNDDDDDDGYSDDDNDAVSDTSSTTAVIAAAEEITKQRIFQEQPSTEPCESIISCRRDVIDDTANLSKSELEAKPFDINSEDAETDFLSLLNNSIGKESPFSLKELTFQSNCKENNASTTDLPNELYSNSVLENSSNIDNILYSTDTPQPEYSDVNYTNSPFVDNIIDNGNTTSENQSENINVNQLMDFQPGETDGVTVISSEIPQSPLLPQDSTENISTLSYGTEFDPQQSNQTNQINAIVPDGSDISYISEQNDRDGQQSDQIIDNSLYLNGSSLIPQEEDRGVALINPGSSFSTHHHLVDNVSEGGNDILYCNDVASSQQEIIAADDSSSDSLCGSDGNTGNHHLSAPLTSDDRDVQMPPVRDTSPKPTFNEAMTAVHISSSDPELGFVPPIWVPDEVATHCMTCGLKFTLIKRKHHCRACGKVLCSSCCNMKYPLPYMGNKDARVCQVCCDVLIQGGQHIEFTDHIEENQEDSLIASQDGTHDDSHREPPSVEYGSCAVEPEPIYEPEPALDSSDADDGLLQDELDQELHGEVGPSDLSALPVVTIPTDSSCNNEPTIDEPSALLPAEPLSPALSDDSDLSFRLDVEHVRAMIPKNASLLPPILNKNKKAIRIQEHPDPAEIMYRLKGLGDTIIFLLNKNLIVKVKIVKLRCCVKKKCWCFVTDGMGAANQEEMVVLLECEHNETAVPKDVLSHFNTAFTYAKQGHVVSDLGFTIFGQPFLGSSNNAGFLYVKPTFQCLENLPLPSVPYVVGILIQRQEAPWAQLFPIRLMLRLGTEFRYYPCPLWSVRNRSSVYQEVGHTIMNLLTDFKNFQYSIPRVTGLVICMEESKTAIRLPQDRFDEMVKVLNAAEEHMFALGANFSSEADSHLVCIQEGENYRTQAINLQNKTKKVTGASFVVFTGSLKTSNPNVAKVSIIEDGIMIQMLPDAVIALRKALREMQDYVITTGSEKGGNAVTQVNVEWVSRDTNKQRHISPIDGQSLTDFPSIQVHSSCDFSTRDIYRIRWTNVFLQRSAQNSRGLASRGLNRLTSEAARACCEALTPHLSGLFQMDLTRISLRVNIDVDSVEYSIGAKQKPLPANLMADLDNALIPSINAAALKHRRGPLTVELFFSVISLF